MTRFTTPLRSIALWSTCLLTLVGSAAAQSRDPHIGYAYPAGGARGETIEVTVGGQYIRDAEMVYVAGEGVIAKVVGWYRPLTRGEYQDLSRQLQEEREFVQAERLTSGSKEPITIEELAERCGITEEQLKEMEIYRQRERDPKRQPNDQLAEEITLQISIAESAPLGSRELRLMTPDAMSNPIWFQIGRWPEFYETEPNDPQPDPAIGSTLPAVINGQIYPGDVDRFSVHAQQGTKLVVRADVRKLMPYLADAVPGWFQAVLVLSDADGRELVYSDSFHFRQDPVLYYEVPEDGEYVVSIRDSIYRGREDFVYRLTLGEIPYIASSYPLGAPHNQETTVQLEGWNLPETELTVRPTRARRNVTQSFPLPDVDDPSVGVSLYVDRSTEHFDQEPNNTREGAQEIPEFAVINGRIDEPGDVDVYRFEGSGRLAVRVMARRAGSPVDSVLTVWDEEGRQIAYNDDLEDRSQALLTHHADSSLTVTLPKSGAYYVQIADAQNNGGSAFVYRMYVTVPQPDFELRVTPSTVIARPGTINPITVYALRSDGFEEDIQLALVDPPSGFVLDGATIPGGVDKLQCTLTVPPQARELPTQLEIEGQATVRGIRRKELAVPAENMMQAFIWYHLVPAEEWNVLINGRAGGKPPVDFPTLAPASQRSRVQPRLKLLAGEPTILPARVIDKNVPPREIRLELREPPPGVTIEKVEAKPGRVEVVFQIDPETAKVGTKGNLILQAFSEFTPRPTERNTNPDPQRRFLSYLPALPFEIVKGRGR